MPVRQEGSNTKSARISSLGEGKDTNVLESKETHMSEETRKGGKGTPTSKVTPAIQDAPTPQIIDPFDPERLRLSQDFSQTVGVKKALLTVPVRKPPKESWIRVHPDPSYRVETAVIEFKEEQETYLVDPSLWPELATEAMFGPRAFFTAITRQKVLFLWPARLPGPEGRDNEWNRSALEAAMRAIDKWVRVVANMSLGAYEVFEATGDIPEPQWPEQSFGELLRIAFKDRFIKDLDHPVLKRLRGEA